MIANCFSMHPCKKLLFLLLRISVNDYCKAVEKFLSFFKHFYSIRNGKSQFKVHSFSRNRLMKLFSVSSRFLSLSLSLPISLYPRARLKRKVFYEASKITEKKESLFSSRFTLKKNIIEDVIMLISRQSDTFFVRRRGKTFSSLLMFARMSFYVIYQKIQKKKQ